jgi:hypothetical protein
MDTLDLADGFDLSRIAQSWKNLSAEHSIGFGSTLVFGNRFGIKMPFSNERRLIYCGLLCSYSVPHEIGSDRSGRSVSGVAQADVYPLSGVSFFTHALIRFRINV